MDNSLFDTIKDSISNIFGEIGKQLNKYKKYIILIILIVLVGFGIVKLIEFIQAEKDKVYLKDKIIAELNCKNTSCVYTKDTSTNNYVWYSGYLWRIVKINDDGTIKLILNESVGLVNYFNGLNNDYLESFIRLWLNEGVFLNGLNNPDNFLATSSFYYGNESVESIKSIKDKVGLLTYSEYNNAGGKNSFLNIEQPFWLITSKKESDQEVFIVDKNGEINVTNTSKLYQVRPVVNLKANIMIVPSTKGTLDNPYVLKGDESLTGNAYLNQRYAGEFIKFAGKVWRIAETTDKYTKLVLYGKDTKMQFGPTNAYVDVKNTIKIYLDNVYYNILKGATPNIDDYLESATLYAGKLNSGDAYTNTKINDSDFRNVTAKIGLLSVGELFSGNDLQLDDKDITWTLTPASKIEDGEVWLSNGESSLITSEYAIRPTIYLKSKVYIIGNSGNGRTRETAYSIEVGK